MTKSPMRRLFFILFFFIHFIFVFTSTAWAYPEAVISESMRIDNSNSYQRNEDVGAAGGPSVTAVVPETQYNQSTFYDKAIRSVVEDESSRYLAVGIILAVILLIIFIFLLKHKETPTVQNSSRTTSS